MSKSKEQLAKALAETGYVADEGLATALLLMEMLGRPMLLEGEAGVGKTEVAKALARLEVHDLLPLECAQVFNHATLLAVRPSSIPEEGQERRGARGAPST